MDFAVRWTDAASADLEDAVQHVREKDVAAAGRLGSGILDHTDILATFPHIGPAYPRGSRGRVREIVYANYRIYYQVFGERRLVEILAVRHGASEPPPLN